jgi:hypothetical protein
MSRIRPLLFLALALVSSVSLRSAAGDDAAARPRFSYMDDLTAPSYEDVTDFFRRYYGP